MYPRDFDSDERVRLMDDAELGCYVRCLNHAWENDGLPTDLDEVRRILHYDKDTFTERWRRVGACFQVSDGRLRNPRQERERSAASSKTRRTEAANQARERKRERNCDENVHENVDV